MTNITETELKSIFNQPPEKVIEFFEEKGLKTSFDWHEVYADSHAKAFTVAKMTELDLLKDTKNILDSAIKEGKSYGKTEKELKELFARKGWIGFKEVGKTGNNLKLPAPLRGRDGEGGKIELGTPRRIKTIITNNINSAYASGRYLEQMDEVDIAPYWQYKAIMDESTRLEHRQLHNRVWKATDPFWQNFYPPNGWNCRCFVVNLTKSQLDRAGLKVENSGGNFTTVTKKVGGEAKLRRAELNEVNEPDNVNARSEQSAVSRVSDRAERKQFQEMKQIPAYKFNDGGIERTLVPDSGWEINVGKSSWGIDVAAWNKVKNVPEQVKLDFLSKMAQNPHREQAFKIWTEKLLSKDYKNTDLEKTLTWITPKLYTKIKPQSPIVVIQDSQIGHSGMNKNLKQALTKDEYLQVYEIINNPDEIYEDYTYKNGRQIAFVRLIPNSDLCIKICVRINQKSRYKNKNYLVSKVTTIGKVNYYNLKTGKEYKKIE